MSYVSSLSLPDGAITKTLKKTEVSATEMSLYPSEVKVEEQTEWAEFWLVSGGSSLVEGKESRKKND